MKYQDKQMDLLTRYVMSLRNLHSHVRCRKGRRLSNDNAKRSQEVAPSLIVQNHSMFISQLNLHEHVYPTRNSVRGLLSSVGKEHDCIKLEGFKHNPGTGLDRHVHPQKISWERSPESAINRSWLLTYDIDLDTMINGRTLIEFDLNSEGLFLTGCEGCFDTDRRRNEVRAQKVSRSREVMKIRNITHIISALLLNGAERQRSTSRHGVSRVASVGSFFYNRDLDAVTQGETPIAFGVNNPYGGLSFVSF